jgi:PBP1b-binding outer membrane lipoprotein LpoB
MKLKHFGAATLLIITGMFLAGCAAAPPASQTTVGTAANPAASPPTQPSDLLNDEQAIDSQNIDADFPAFTLEDLEK